MNDTTRTFYYPEAVLKECKENDKGEMVLPRGIYQLNRPMWGMFVASRETFAPCKDGHSLIINGNLEYDCSGVGAVGAIDSLTADRLDIKGHPRFDDGVVCAEYLNVNHLFLDNCRLDVGSMDVTNAVIPSSCRVHVREQLLAGTVLFTKVAGNGGHSRIKGDAGSAVSLQISEEASFAIRSVEFSLHVSTVNRKPFIAVGNRKGLAGACDDRNRDERFQSLSCFVYSISGVGDSETLTCILTETGPVFSYGRANHGSYQYTTEELLDDTSADLKALYRQVGMQAAPARWAQHAMIIQFAMQMELITQQYARGYKRGSDALVGRCMDIMNEYQDRIVEFKIQS